MVTCQVDETLMEPWRLGAARWSSGGKGLVVTTGHLSSLSQVSWMNEKVQKLLDKARVSKKANLRGLKDQPIPDALWEIEDLTELDLSRCNLTQLPSELASLKGLKSLNLRENPLLEVPVSLCELPLETLHFDSPEIKDFPEHLFQISSIKEFSCSADLLTAIPPQISNWKKLSLLDLRSNPIEVLSEEFYGLKHLKIVVLLDCELKSVESDIANLNKLKSLGLQKNRLCSLPDEVLQLSKLENLYLSDNKISALKPAGWSLPKLKNLNIGNNPLESLPEAIGSCPSLALLLAPDCQIRTLPKSLLNCSKLERLDLTNNPLPIHDALKAMGNNYPTVLNTKGLLNHLASFGEEHPVWGGTWPKDQTFCVTPSKSATDRVFEQYNQIGLALTEEGKTLTELPRGPVENFLVQEFRLQLTNSGLQNFVATYGWSEKLRERLKDGFLKIGAVRFWRYVLDLEKAAPTREHVDSSNKKLEKIDLKVFKLLNQEDPTELLLDWLSEQKSS